MANSYAALANTIRIKDITSNTHSQTILQRLKDNDESFDTLYIMDRDGMLTGDDDKWGTSGQSIDICGCGYIIGIDNYLYI